MWSVDSLLRSFFVDILSQVANFIHILAQKTSEISETAGRVQPGFQDVVLSCQSLVRVVVVFELIRRCR